MGWMVSYWSTQEKDRCRGRPEDEPTGLNSTIPAPLWLEPYTHTMYLFLRILQATNYTLGGGSSVTASWLVGWKSVDYAAWLGVDST